MVLVGRLVMIRPARYLVESPGQAVTAGTSDVQRASEPRRWTQPADNPASPVILLTGGSGYVGGRLIPLLEQQGVRLRCLARNPEKMRSRVQPGTEIVQGDVLDAASLDEALQGVHTAYYLVHLMSGSKDFEKEDRQAATNFAAGRKEGRGAAHHLPGRAG